MCSGGHVGAAGEQVGGSTNPDTDCSPTVTWAALDRTGLGPGVRAGSELPVLVLHMLLVQILQFPSCVLFYFYLAYPFIPLQKLADS